MRDAVRMDIGDTGLLNYVSKSMNNVLIGGHFIFCLVNPKIRILEYSIVELGKENRTLRFIDALVTVMVE